VLSVAGYGIVTGWGRLSEKGSLPHILQATHEHTLGPRRVVCCRLRYRDRMGPALRERPVATHPAESVTAYHLRVQVPRYVPATGLRQVPEPVSTVQWLQQRRQRLLSGEQVPLYGDITLQHVHYLAFHSFCIRLLVFLHGPEVNTTFCM
jgi:hypothetical protein